MACLTLYMSLLLLLTTYQIPLSLHKAIQSERKLAKTWIINHERLKFLFELLHSVVTYAEENKLVTYDNPLQKVIQMFHRDMISITVAPFNKLNGEGDLKPFYETLPALTRLISIAGKWKIVRANIFLIAQVSHYYSQNILFLSLRLRTKLFISDLF